jgi:hypothetical protein
VVPRTASPRRARCGVRSRRTMGAEHWINGRKLRLHLLGTRSEGEDLAPSNIPCCRLAAEEQSRRKGPNRASRASRSLAIAESAADRRHRDGAWAPWGAAEDLQRFLQGPAAETGAREPWEARNLRLPLEVRQRLDEHRPILMDAGVAEATRGRLLAALVTERGPATGEQARPRWRRARRMERELPRPRCRQPARAGPPNRAIGDAASSWVDRAGAMACG